MDERRPQPGTAPQPVVPVAPAPIQTTSTSGPDPHTVVLHAPDVRRARWVLIRDLLVFQAKLFIDGFKDLVLGPFTLIAGVADLFASPGKEGRHLYRALRRGRDFENWLNLFEPIEREERAGTQLAAPSERGMDAHIQSVERLLVEQVQRGGMTAAAKERIDGALDSLRSNAMLGPRWRPPAPGSDAPTVPAADRGREPATSADEGASTAPPRG